MRRSHLQKIELFRELKLFYSKLKVVGEILMKTKIDFILNGFFFFGAGEGGGNSKKTSFKFQKLSTSILLEYYNTLCDSMYGVSVSVVKIFFKSLKLT